MNRKGSNHIMFAGMKLYNPNDYIMSSSTSRPNCRTRPSTNVRNLPKLSSSVYLIPLKKPRTQTAQTLESRSTEASNSEINFAYFRKNIDSRPDSRVHPDILPFLMYVSQKSKNERSNQESFTGAGVAFSASGTQMLSDEALEACNIIFPKPAFWKFYKSKKYAMPSFLVQQPSQNRKLFRPAYQLGELPFRFGKPRTRVFLSEAAYDLELEQRLNELDEDFRGHPPKKKRKIELQLHQNPDLRLDLNHNLLVPSSESEMTESLDGTVFQSRSRESFSVTFKEANTEFLENLPNTSSDSSITSTESREETTVVEDFDLNEKDLEDEVDLNNNERERSNPLEEKLIEANLQMFEYRPREPPTLTVQKLIIFDSFQCEKSTMGVTEKESLLDLQDPTKVTIKEIDLNNNQKDQRLGIIEIGRLEPAAPLLLEPDANPKEDLPSAKTLPFLCRTYTDKSTNTDEWFVRTLNGRREQSVGTRHIDSLSILRQKRTNFLVDTQQFFQDSLRTYQSTTVPSAPPVPLRRKSGSELTNNHLPETGMPDKTDRDSLLGKGYKSTVSESVILPAISRRKRLLNQAQIQPSSAPSPPDPSNSHSENHQKEIGPRPAGPTTTTTANSNISTSTPKAKGMIRRCWMSIRSTFHRIPSSHNMSLKPDKR